MPIWDLLKDTEGFVGPVLLLIIGGLFRLAQSQMQDRRKTRELAAEKEKTDKIEANRLAGERERKDEENRREAQRIADQAREAAEKTAREDRARLERDLEREREDRKREADRQRDETAQLIHGLKNKVQTAENLQGIHDRQVKLLEEKNDLLEEKLQNCQIESARLRRRLQKYEPLSDDE
jgi:hypothetical protein